MAVAEVNKVLASVGSMCDAGNEVTFRKDGGTIKNTTTGAEMGMKRVGGSYEFDLWVPKGAGTDTRQGSGTVGGGPIKDGPKSVLAVFQLETGKVETSTHPGVSRFPQWTGEGKVRRARWMDMETMEVLDSMDFTRHSK